MPCKEMVGRVANDVSEDMENNTTHELMALHNPDPKCVARMQAKVALVAKSVG